MVIRFEKNAYYKAVTNDKNLNSEFKMLDKAKKELSFHYGKVNREEFNNDYSSKGWVGRKVICIPAALMCGLVKTTYHLTQAILIGIVKAPFDGGKYFLAKTFSVAQDIEQSGGWVATLFNDRLGQFHVEKSAFQKTCYARHLSKDELAETDELIKCRVSYNEKKEADNNLKAGEIDNALVAVIQWPTSSEKTTYLTTICEAYIKKGEFEKVLSMEGLSSEVLMNFTLNIGYQYLSMNDGDNALVMAEKISDKSSQESLKISIAENFLKNEKIPQAIEVLSSLDHKWDFHNASNRNDVILRCLLLDIADKCIGCDPMNAFKAMELIKMFEEGSDTREAQNLRRLLQHFAQKNDAVNFLSCIGLLVDKSFLIHHLARIKYVYLVESDKKILVIPENILGAKYYSNYKIIAELTDDIILEIKNNNVSMLELGDLSIQLCNYQVGIGDRTLDDLPAIFTRDYVTEHEEYQRMEDLRFTNRYSSGNLWETAF